jgi:hypothetical protein
MIMDENLDGDKQNESEHSVIPQGDASKAEIKHAAMLLLSESGMSAKAIGKAVDRHEKHVARMLPELRKESLRHPHKLKLASKCVDKLMEGFVGKAKIGPDRKVMRDEKGEPIVEYDHRVKASDAKAAAEMCYKAAGELTEQGSGVTQQTFIEVNMAMFRK